LPGQELSHVIFNSWLHTKLTQVIKQLYHTGSGCREHKPHRVSSDANIGCQLRQCEDLLSVFRSSEDVRRLTSRCQWRRRWGHRAHGVCGSTSTALHQAPT
jgi:hypothetical protein